MTQFELLKSIRQYFWSLNFTEIEIPYLNSSLPLEPNLYTFKSTWTHRNKDYFLPASPEFALKKYLTKNKKNCFAISHCFRDLEDEGPDHTPEFLMLEWYEVNKNYQDLMLSTQNFIKKFLDIEFTTLNLPSNLPQNEPDFNQYFLNEIETNLPKNKAVFITGYPAFLSPLAAVSNSELNNFSAHSEREGMSPKVASTAKISLTSDRFELYINGLEIANGCTENTDSKSILKSFNSEKDYRLKNNLPLHPINVAFANNSAKLNQVSGIGLGINRLLKIINQK